MESWIRIFEILAPFQLAQQQPSSIPRHNVTTMNKEHSVFKQTKIEVDYITSSTLTMNMFVMKYCLCT